MAEFLVELGIDPISLNPDSVIKTTRLVVEAERRLGGARRPTVREAPVGAAQRAWVYS